MDYIISEKNISELVWLPLSTVTGTKSENIDMLEV